MSNPTPPGTPSTSDNSLDPVFSSVRSLLIVLGTILAAHGYGQSPLYEWIELSSGAIMIVGPAAWGVWTAIQNYRAKRAIRTEGVAAGMNLALSGSAILTQVNGVSVPKPVTEEAANQIVKDFADKQVIIPNAEELTKALVPTQVVQAP